MWWQVRTRSAARRRSLEHALQMFRENEPIRLPIVSPLDFDAERTSSRAREEMATSITRGPQAHPMPNAADRPSCHHIILPFVRSSFECFQSRMKDSSSNSSIGVAVDLDNSRRFAPRRVASSSSLKRMMEMPFKKGWPERDWETRRQNARARSRSVTVCLRCRDSTVIWSALGTIRC